MTNWSLILNVLLLIGVVVAIFNMLKAKHQEKNKQQRHRYVTEPRGAEPKHDDIIAVRKLSTEATPAVTPIAAAPKPELKKEPAPAVVQAVPVKAAAAKPVSLMMFLLAKDNRQLGGYDLLQTLLATGLRFGDDQLFHRHQLSNGQGPVICSLAAATDSGVFDLQNMGAFSARGLCLFMESSGNASIDAERLAIMFDTAKALSTSLDTHLLDDERIPWSDSSLLRYQSLLNITSEISNEAAVCLD
ncbi:MAG: cell division protein ZipA C-terminal FtsZ-binding domain-containing protein [Legionella sp.]|nr:cell division protein ZipA C-terminal FtsZ-binding domain-containing protein [Legionella sp.]